MFETEEQSAINLVVRLPHHLHQQYASVYAKTYPYQDLPPLKHLFSLFTKQNAWQVGAIPAPKMILLGRINPEFGIYSSML